MDGRRTANVASRAAVTRGQHCGDVNDVENSILAGGDFIITSSVDEQSDVENLLSEIVSNFFHD